VSCHRDDYVMILAAAYLRLRQGTTKVATTRQSAPGEESSDSAPERLDFPGGTPMTCAGRDGGRNANPSQELR
jgi:hypothetical protein